MCDIVLVPHPSAQLRNPVQRHVTQGVFSASFSIPPASGPTPAIALKMPVASQCLMFFTVMKVLGVGAKERDKNYSVNMENATVGGSIQRLC